MKKNLLFFILLCISCLSIVCIVTCTKEYSYEGGRSAIYILAGSPADCAGAILNGNYYATVPADSSNAVNVSVYVTTPGNYLITTGTVNGISFSAAGTFADTGIYTMRLQANGTPAAAGSFQFQITGNNGCFFSLDVIEKPMAEYVLSSIAGSCDNPQINGTYIATITPGSLENIDINVDVITAGDYIITTDTVNGIYFSASGAFTATGNQTVTLQSNGKPAAAGLFYFNINAGTSSCSFKLVVQNTEPLAVYVLQSSFGNPNPCYPQTINGGYKTGIALAGGNTVDITAYVTVVGNYSISTGVINGMIFSASGTFTGAGLQTVTLAGSGIPLNAGSNTFLPEILGPSPLGGNQCGFVIVVL